MNAIARLSVAIVLATLVVIVREQCVHPNPAFNITYPNFTCPVGTTCFWDQRFDAPNQLYVSVPVGCCPDNLTQGCLSNDALLGLDGCCGANQTCCYWERPLQRRWMGCADKAERCCVNQICPEDYYCCRTRSGHGCCPSNTTCFNANYKIFPNVTGPALNLTALFNVSYPKDICLPVSGRQIPIVYVVGDRNQTSNRLPNGDLKPEFWQVALRNVTVNTTKCGRYLCREGDVCINRYWNSTYANYTLNTTAPGCNGFSDNVAFNEVPDNCRIKNIFPRERVTPRGCCPTNHTPCGRLANSFAPVDPSLPQLQNPFDRMMGCVGPNETCCFPQICPVGMKCCEGVWSSFNKTAKYPTTADGYIVNGFLAGSVNTSGVNGTMIGFGNTFAQCCPINTTCCQIAITAPDLFNTWGEIFGFCGIDDTCTLNAFRPQYIVYSNTSVSPIVEPIDSFNDFLSEGYNPRIRSTFGTGMCNIKYGENNYFNMECGQLGGDFKTPESQFALPSGQTYLDNTNPTQQVNLAFIFNVTYPKTPQRPRPPVSP